MPSLLSLPAVPHSRHVRLGITGVTCLAVLLLAAGAWLGYAGLRRVWAMDALSDQVRQTQLATETVLSTLKDAETGQRGFLLTGNPAYLEPYTAARERLDADLARLEQASVLGPGYRVRARRMRELAMVKLAELEETVALRRAGNAEAALAVVRTNRGKQVMDALRAEADALQANAENKARASERYGVLSQGGFGGLMLVQAAMDGRRVDVEGSGDFADGSAFADQGKGERLLIGA